MKLETSLPIKCPTVAIQLSGLKKVQQVLAQWAMCLFYDDDDDDDDVCIVYRDDVMKRFVPDVFSTKFEDL